MGSSSVYVAGRGSRGTVGDKSFGTLSRIARVRRREIDLGFFVIPALALEKATKRFVLALFHLRDPRTPMKWCENRKRRCYFLSTKTKAQEMFGIR